MKVALTIVLALLLHWILGWAWTCAAGLVGGFWKGPGGWYLGGLAVGSAWLVWLLYNVAVAPAAVMRMAGMYGGIMGGIPGPVILATTLVMGILIGTVGGGLGSQLRLIMYRR